MKQEEFESLQETDGYIYNSRRNIRTRYALEKTCYHFEGYFISFLVSVQYLRGNEWERAGSRWLICEDDIRRVMDSGFKEFPSIFK